MGTYDYWRTSREAEETGQWVQAPDGSRWRLRRASSTAAQAGIREAELPHLATIRSCERRGIDLPEELAERLIVEKLVRGIVVAWEGVTGPDGQPLAFTPDNVRRVLSDLRDLRMFLVEAAGTFATFHERETEAAERNLPRP